MIGSSVVNCLRDSFATSDAVLKYMCRNLFEFADAPISESAIATKARIATVHHNCRYTHEKQTLEEIEAYFLTICHPLLQSKLTNDSECSNFNSHFGETKQTFR